MALNLFSVLPIKEGLIKLHKPKTAYLYFYKKRLNLLTNNWEKYDFHLWLSEQSFKLCDHQFENRLIHFYYELGFLFENIVDLTFLQEVPLVMDLEYTQKEKFNVKKNTKKIKLKSLKRPSFSDYESRFKKGYNELEKGNCYQFNLTEEFIYSTSTHDALDFINQVWNNEKNRGCFGSATYIEATGELLFSNSPECLFQYEKKTLVTRPIKGTFKLNHTSELKQKWRELKKDVKSQAELYMITDLLRNDLCRIDKPSALVTKLKAPLMVPGLLHQYSEIKIELEENVRFINVISKMFPGGSITGAPKKRVMGLLKEIEKRERRFYCGSTCWFTKGKIEASINIRSAEINLEKKTLRYQAGGGVTLLSSAKDEFDELTYKHDSFIDLLTL
jgi:para-aminobenzoate synthetase component 1